MLEGADGISRLLSAYSLYTGRELSVDESVYASERDTGHRNRAIAHLLRGSGVIEGDPEVALDLYFRQCSVAVTCHDLALVAATLANGGLNPVTGQRAARDATTRRALTVMASCGMYDAAGDWLYTVGFPARSGVSGCILAVLPGKLGIAVFSPPLDERGNSVRGVRVCQDLARDLDLRLIQSGGQQPIRASRSVAELGSKRIRSAAERATLDEHDADAVALELQGELDFPEAETVIRHLVGAQNVSRLAVLDFHRVVRAGVVVAPFFAELHEDFAERGGRLVFSGLGGHPELLEALLQATPARGGETELLTFDELDAALEWCETELLLSSAAGREPATLVPLHEHELLRGLWPQDLAAVEELLERHEFEAGACILRAGDVTDEIYLVTRGALSVMGTIAGGRSRRLATLSAGMVLGELAFATGQPRTSTVWADSAVECYALSAADLGELARDRPTAEAAVLRNLVAIISTRAARMRSELALVTD